ncbi:unnamed protein product [Leptidea sinapis]|uniref:Uncharacterized protein n=1 Tax=Leptidea sinapis TaxID=189913 RepID=A0A5E4Q1X4_9NEOP|nr:unnamed protein product [Leptidea sinapis]
MLERQECNVLFFPQATLSQCPNHPNIINRRIPENIIESRQIIPNLQNFEGFPPSRKLVERYQPPFETYQQIRLPMETLQATRNLPIEAYQTPIRLPMNLPIELLQPQLGLPIESYQSSVVPSTTTVVTDCTPTVCKNLANTIQLMIVSSLLKNSKGGSDVGLQLASPFLNEVITSDYPPLSPQLISSSYSNYFSNVGSNSGPTLSSSYPNGLLGNVLGFLSN